MKIKFILLAFLIISFQISCVTTAGINSKNSANNEKPVFSTDFLTLVAIPQLVAGKNYNANDMYLLFALAVRDGAMNQQGEILNHVRLGEIAFAGLGLNLSLAFGIEHPENAVLYAKRLSVINNNVTDYILLNKNEKAIYDPGNKYTNDQSKWKHIEDVYIYAK
jgi:hypothetical protein